MHRGYLMLFIILMCLCLGVAFAQVAVAPGTQQLIVTGMCEGQTWTAWKLGENLLVTCGDKAPPPKAVELRPFYVVPSNAGRR